MFIELDFESSEAIYLQLYHQIILGIANDLLKEGETLPSVRSLAGEIGVNMHTVNKAYTVLKEDGFLSVDQRRGAVVAVDKEKIRAMQTLRDELRISLAKASCRHVSRDDVHALIDELYEGAL